MITFETYMGTVDMSCDSYRHWMERLSFIYKSEDQKFLEDKMLLTELGFLGTINRYMRLKGYAKPKDMRILRAHGRTDGEYEFYDGIDDEERYISVERWIERHESYHDLLFIESCNRSRIMLEPRDRTFLIFPLGTYSRLDLINAIHYEERPSSIVLLPPKYLDGIIRPSRLSL